MWLGQLRPMATALQGHGLGATGPWPGPLAGRASLAPSFPRGLVAPSSGTGAPMAVVAIWPVSPGSAAPGWPRHTEEEVAVVPFWVCSGARSARMGSGVRLKKSIQNIFKWFCRNFKSTNCMWSLASVSSDWSKFLSWLMLFWKEVSQ
jgi:hypothetical protein